MTEKEKEQALEKKAKQYAEIFNGFRFRFEKSRMNGSALSELICKMGLPKNDVFRKILAKYGVIIKNGDKRHCFWTMPQQPVHFEKFKNVFRDWEKYLKEKNTNSRSKSKEKKAFQILNEENAIVLLKSLGYKIQKQIIHYEEV